MWAMKATRPSTTTCPPPGQSKYPTCFTPRAPVPLPSCRIPSPGIRLVPRLVTTSGRVTSSGRSDGGTNGRRDQSEKLQHPPEIRPAKLDDRVAHPEALVLAELIDEGLRALGEKLVAQAEAHRDLDGLP